MSAGSWKWGEVNIDLTLAKSFQWHGLNIFQKISAIHVKLGMKFLKLHVPKWNVNLHIIWQTKENGWYSKVHNYLMESECKILSSKFRKPHSQILARVNVKNCSDRAKVLAIFYDHGAFINYVDRILRIFDSPSPLCWQVY